MPFQRWTSMTSPKNIPFELWGHRSYYTGNCSIDVALAVGKGEALRGSGYSTLAGNCL